MTAPLTLRTFIQDRLSVTAPRQGLHEITGDIVAWLDDLDDLGHLRT